MKTKKILAALAAFTMTCSAVTSQPFASLVKNSAVTVSAETSASDFEFDAETGTITKYNGTDTEVVIPSEINDVAVTGIRDFAFSYCTSLTKVTIPDSVKSIGDCAFAGCESLTDITIPDSVISIGDDTFVETEWLNIQKANNDLLIVNGTLIDGTSCSGEVILPDTVTSVSSKAFYHCKTITGIIIPDSVTNISTAAFEGCVNLTNVSFGENSKLDSIGSAAFFECSNLADINIPDSVTSIGSSAFCKCSSVKSIKIPDSVSIIDIYTFQECSGLESIVIPDSVTSIGRFAFYNCSSIKSITLPAAVIDIGYNAFTGCLKLESFDVDENNTEYASKDGVLFNKDYSELIQYAANIKDETYEIPASVISIGNNAFTHCVNLTSITIPDSVATIGDAAFYGCTALKSISIPASVEKIKDYYLPFGYCTSLDSILVDEANPNYKSIDGNLYEVEEDGSLYFMQYALGSPAEEFTIPDNVSSIRGFSFQGNTCLKTIYIPDNFKPEIMYEDEYSRWDDLCAMLLRIENLENIVVGENNPYYSSFEGNLYSKDGKILLKVMPAKTEYTFPDSVEKTYILASEYDFSKYTPFTYNANLKKINISKNISRRDFVSPAGGASWASAFKGCSALEEINVNPENEELYSIDGDLYSRYHYYLDEEENILMYHCKDNNDTFIVSEDIDTVDDTAFINCDNLKNVVFMGKDTEIFDLTGNFGYIYKYVIGSDNSVKSDDFTVIGNVDSEAYKYVNSDSPETGDSRDWINFVDITTVNLDEIIGGNASIVKEGECGENVTYTLDPDGLLTISGTGALTRQFSYNNIKKIIINEGVTSICDYGFSQCSELTSIIIPDSVTSIGIAAFGDCAKLIDIILPDGLTSIGNQAFLGCTSLKEISIPESVTSIGETAFWECTGLEEIIIPKNVKYWGLVPFGRCTNLKKVTFSEGITEIGIAMFLECKSLESVIIPESVTSIGTLAFYDTLWLEQMKTENPLVIVNDIVIDGFACSSGVTIPADVTSICEKSLGYAIDENNNAVKIEDFVINGYKGTAAEIYANENGFEFIALDDSDTTSDFEFDAETGTITKYNGSATELVIPSEIEGVAVTAIGEDSFSCCDSLTSITIPESVISIESNAFSECDSLTNIVIPDSVTSTGLGLFNGCDNLKSVKFSDSMTKIEDLTFMNCVSLTDVVFPENLTSIEFLAFSGCESLTSITIPNSVTSLATSAFSGCSNLTEINIPDSITSIGSFAFGSCSGLKSVKIGKGITKIFNYTFSDCESLTSVTIPETVTEIGEVAFEGCENLTISGYAGSVAETYANENGFEFIALDLDAEIVEEGQCGENVTYTIDSNGVLTVSGTGDMYSDRKSTFSDNKNITAVIISDGVTSVGSGAFEECSNLETVSIPDSVTVIEAGAFYKYPKLRNVTIPEKITDINLSAFEGTGLTEITIPANTLLGFNSIGFTIDDDGNTIKNVSFIIKGYNGSYAETYAADFGFEFISLGDAPTPEFILGVVDGDGKISAMDASAALTYYVMNPATIEELGFTFNIKAAD